MKSVIVLSLVGLLAVVPARAGEEIAWAKDYAAAQAEAEKSGKLIMVDFYTDWCGWCKVLDKETYSNAAVVEFSKKIVSVKVNAEKEGVELAKKYGVSGYPTILFVTAGGEQVGRMGGYSPPEPFLDTAQRIQWSHAELPMVTAALKSNPADPEANAKLAAIRALRGEQKPAEEALAKAETAGFKGNILADAYNALGDLYQERRELDTALTLFGKAVASASEVKTRAYAKVSIAYCLMSKGDQAGGRKAAEEVVKMEGAPKYYVDMAQRILDSKP